MRLRWARAAAVVAVASTLTLTLSTPAQADNCGSLTDCFSTLAAALAIIAAVSILVALFLMFPPGGAMMMTSSGLMVAGSVAVPSAVITQLLGVGAISATGALILAMASTPGGGGNNRSQNRQFKEAVRRIERDLGRKLSRDDIQRLHREISKQGLTLDEIVEWGLTLFG